MVRAYVAGRFVTQNPPYRHEASAVLPEGVERLDFGKHRMAWRDRWCPAWPMSAHHRPDAEWRAMLKRTQRDPAYMMTVAAGANRPPISATGRRQSATDDVL